MEKLGNQVSTIPELCVEEGVVAVDLQGEGNQVFTVKHNILLMQWRKKDKFTVNKFNILLIVVE